MTVTDELLAEISQFLAETGMGSAYFGKAAVGQSELIRRLEEGGSVTLPTLWRLRAFMAQRSAGERPRHIPTPRAKAPAEAFQ